MSQSRQAETLLRHMRNALQGDSKVLFDEVWREYKRKAKIPANAIGFLEALLAMAYADMVCLPSRSTRVADSDAGETHGSGA